MVPGSRMRMACGAAPLEGKGLVGPHGASLLQQQGQDFRGGCVIVLDADDPDT
jgi:hypothetical protein